MTLSILHRVSGVALSIGLVVLAAWLVTAASDTASYAAFTRLMSSMAGTILLVGFSAAFFFHLANGIRHLVWDFGRGFELQQATASAWFVLALTIVLTAAFWWLL